MDSQDPRPAFRLSLVLVFASGAAGLAHQVIWTRRLVDLLGASAETFSRVVGTFFLGLALGAWIASRKPMGPRSGWRGVGLAELTVGLLAIPLLFSPFWSEPLYAWTGLESWLRLLLPVLLILPPAIAMGLIVPWLIDATEVPRRGANFTVWIYAVNTCGGIVGVVAMMLAPLPEVGLVGAGLLVCGVNLVIAAVALGVSRRASAVAPISADGGRGQRQSGQIAVSDRSGAGKSVPPNNTDLATSRIRALAFASGFLVLAIEVMLQHHLAQVTVNSHWAGSAVLGLVLLALAVAAAAVPLLVRLVGEMRALRIALIATAALCAVQPFLFVSLRKGLTLALPTDLGAGAYVGELLKLGAVAACPLLLAAGLVFPLLLRGPAGQSGQQVGRLLALNGLGGWLGAESAQRWLAPQFGLWVSIELLAAGYLALWGMLILRRDASLVWRGLGLAGGAALLAVGAVAAGRLPQAGTLRNERIAGIHVGREGVVATIEVGPGDWRVLLNNDYTLGGSLPQFNQERQALLPLLLHGRARTVATLGVATGSTTAGAAAFPGVEHIDAIELSPLVLQSAREFFGPYNRRVFEDPRVRFIEQDARWEMARKPGTYDVILGDLFLPWRTGEGRLFAREHFENVRRALKPGGVFCQWLPLFQLTPAQFDTIVRTFRTAFPEAFLIRGDFRVDRPVVGLVGGIELAAIDWAGVEQAAAQVRAAGVVRDPLMRHREGVVLMVIGPAPDPGPGPINTLANCWLEWDAGRNVLGRTPSWLTGPPWVERARTAHAAGRSLLPEAVRGSHAAGGFFFEVEAADVLRLPAYPALVRQTPERMPSALREDSAADWRQWPSRREVALPGVRRP